MSALALQRVMVRMLHDPDLDRATRDAGLTPTEKEWLAQVDPRRWRADPLRRYRLLQTLIEAYPVSVALCVRARDVAFIDRFFESPCFHASVQNRRVLAIDFGGWLIDAARADADALAPVAEYAHIEHAIAQVRRAPSVHQPADPTRRWRLAPWIKIGRGPLDAWQQMRGQLLAHPGGPTAGILDPSFGVHSDVSSPSAWLVDGSCEPQVEALPSALYMALDALREPQDWTGCLAGLTRAGADVDDADDLLRSFIDDVLLTATED